MKRALLILLMMLLPLQTTWASMAGVRDLVEVNYAQSGVDNASQLLRRNRILNDGSFESRTCGSRPVYFVSLRS